MKELERIISRQGESRPKVLLHSCCGPCSSSVLEYLTQFFDITLLWYNPNLYPQEEFDRRLETQLRLISDMGLSERVSVITTDRRSEEYYARVGGLENEPEGGKRCTECFRLRLEECAKLAKEHDFDYFCTTLTLSRHKDAIRINNLAEKIAADHGVKWLPSDFKKRNGEGRSLELCEQYNVYRQLYCGCEFSFKRRQQVAEQMKK